MIDKSVKLYRGLPVHDADRTEIVHVKKSDLTSGYTRLHDRCAVHRALVRDQSKKKDDIHVHNTTIYIRNGNHWVRYKMSIALRIQIAVHDQGGLMKEGDYKLLPFARSARFEATRAYHQLRAGKKTAKARAHGNPIGVRDRPGYVCVED